MSAAPNIPQITLYQRWLRETRGLSFDSYDALWRWSVTTCRAFWQSIWDYFELQSPTPHTAVLAGGAMPGAQWFPGAQVNYAHQVFRHVDAAHAAGLPAIISRNEKGKHRELSWPELAPPGGVLALHLQGRACSRATAWRPTCPTSPRPWSPSWRW
jgi:acetoacetyl-CoA synthetase